MRQLVILAGGKGTRMQSETPKVLQSIGGTTIIEYQLRGLAQIFPRPVIVIGHKGVEIRAALGDRFLYAVQEEQLGTGNALMSAKELLADVSTVVVIPGDHPLVTLGTIVRLFTEHEGNNAALSLVSLVVPMFGGEYQIFEHFGRVIRNSNGSVGSIVEWKDASAREKSICEVNLGFYCFDAAWLWANIGTLSNENNSKEYYLTDMVKIAHEQGKQIIAVPTTNVFEAMGVNTPEQLKMVEKYIGVITS